MAKQTIGIGSAPNDGSGDPLRTAFSKINSNFNEVYSSYQMSGTLTANGLIVGADITANTTAIKVGTSTINATNYSGTANNALYLGGAAASQFLTTTQLAANVATLTANNTLYLGGNAAAKFVQNTDSRTLSGNLLFTGTNNVFQANVTTLGYLIANDDIIIPRPEGRIVFCDAGDIGSSTNFMYIERSTALGEPCIEFSSYNNINTYFRYSNSGIAYVWTVDGTGAVVVGNSTVNVSINSTAFSGISNNANNLGGVAAANYVQNTDSRTLSGNLHFTGSNNVFDSNTVGLGTSTIAANGYTYLPNGLKMNWGVVSANSSDGNVVFTSAFSTALYTITVTGTNTEITTIPVVTGSNTTEATIRTSNDTPIDVYFTALGF